MSFSSYKNIQDRTLDILSRSDTTTRNRVKNWINAGYADFVTRELWPFRETTTILSTTAGTQEYTIEDELEDIDLQNILAVSVQGATESRLSYVPFNQLRMKQPDFTSVGPGVPLHYYLKAGQIGFWPTPNAAYEVAVDYYVNAEELVEDADEPIIPARYREALMHYALDLEYKYNSDFDQAAGALNRYEQIVALARNNLLAQPADIGSFRITGPMDIRNHTDIGR